MRKTRRRVAHALALLLASLTAAQAADGDFGRKRPSLLDGIVPPQFWKGPVTGQSSFPLTDAENELRDRAYTLIRPVESRVEFNVVVGKFRIAQIFPPTAANEDHRAYGRNVLWMPGRSETSQYNQLIDDMMSDAQLIPPFVRVACYVADMDAKRARSLAYVSELTPDERENALGRIAENRGTTLWVREALFQRAVSYRHALERFVIAVPSGRAVDAERILKRFDAAVIAASDPLTRCGGDAGFGNGNNGAAAAPPKPPVVWK